VCPIVGLGAVQYRKNHCSCWESNTGTLVRKLVTLLNVIPYGTSDIG